MPFPLFAFLAAAPADEIVVTASRAPQSAAETGQAVTVLDRDLIEQRQAVIVSDLLAQTPGVAVSRNGGVGGFTGLRIRGAEAEQTLVLIDGVKVNDPSSPGGGFDFANLLADNIARIEVLRGPNSVPWGSQAIGGVVNIITARPTAEPTLTARAEGGSFGTAQAVANGSFTAGPVAASLGGGYFTTDGISAARAGTERDGYERYAANGRIEVALSDSIAIDLRGYFDHGRTELDGFPPPSFTFADTPEFSTIQELFGYAGVRATFLDGRFVNRAAFTIGDVNRDNFAAPGSAPSFIARGRVERFEYQGDLKATDWARIVFGAESERSRFGDGTSVFRTGIDSGWGELIVKPVAPLTLTGGVRHDDHRDFGGHTSFGGNAALGLGHTVVRASYAEGFKAPTLFQLRSDFGNPALRPETARSIDVGVEQRLIGGALSGSLTWFHRRTRNQIDFTPCRTDIAICADGARPFGTYDNIARARASGVEAALDLRPTDTLRINASYTYVDAENRTPGSPDFGTTLLRRPKSSVALNADWRAPVGLSLGGTLRQVSDSIDRDAFGTRVRLDGYVLADLRVSYPVSDRLEIYGRVENLFDARYETVLDYNTAGRAAYAGVRVRL
ncbi:vitamin B12 transporter BtuB [Sphingomonas changbaiensis NBRC 104936]|uniref:Vitamin B12 transporter BtuB n=1 Tax=Sphingomonas changbaiensis NBRC 104936 TaxID=1219043 RepID=A0A0E9MLE8_9SPHN|nr:TonB-dependent receptor [Sphingomonas changbaiensis]GAO38343.1 vitamin B12 transporter BtuB [Sphingomonas changbaiensis NBRC 104936]